MRSTVFTLLFLANIIFYGLTAIMTFELINSKAVIEPRTYSWKDDWDILVILLLLATMNVLGGLFLFKSVKD